MRTIEHRSGTGTACGPGTRWFGQPHFCRVDLTAVARIEKRLWDALDWVDSHFWVAESFRRYMESRTETLPVDAQRPSRHFWGSG